MQIKPNPKPQTAMINQHQTIKIQLAKLSVSSLAIFICFFMASCSKNALPEPQKKASPMYTQLPKGFKLIEEMNPKSQTETRVMKLEKGMMYTIRLVKSKENHSKVLLYNGDKRIVSSFARGRYYGGINYLCKKTGNYTFVIEADPKQVPPKVVFAFKKS
ncbi:MAG TPA: hypothetical protein DCS93_36180 [Microscillaceae bacterium]|nr:hypothetical protein [Microscillaceae bacterium]